MARTRMVLGVALAVVALAYGAWGMGHWWLNVSRVLMGVYGLAAIAGLSGPKALRDAAFGLALFGGANFLLDATEWDRLLPTRPLAGALHIRLFNAAWGTHLIGNEGALPVLPIPDPTISAMQRTQRAAFEASSLAFGLIGAVLAFVLGRRTPLRSWSRGPNFAALAAGLAGMTAGFVLPGWWASFLAFHAVFGLFLAAALGARFGPLDARARLFGFALVGGVVFVLGSYRFVVIPSQTSWLQDPVCMLLVKVGTWNTPANDPEGGFHLVGGYVLSELVTAPNPLRSRICLASLFSAIPIGLVGAGVAVGASRLRSGSWRLRLSGTLRGMLAIAGSAVVMMAFRSVPPPWTAIEHQMIFGLCLAAAFWARFGSPRGRPFSTGFALFGLANVAIVASSLMRWTPLSVFIEGVAFPTVVAAFHVNQQLVCFMVAYTTSSLVAALMGGALCALMIPSRREPILPE